MGADRSTQRSRAAVRAVTGALCAVLAALATVATLGALSADRATARLERSGDLVEAYLQLTRAVAIQDAAEERFASRTREATLAEFLAAQESIDESLEVLARGDRQDRDLRLRIGSNERRYAADFKRYLSALDAGDAEEAEAAEAAADPSSQALQFLVSEGGPRQATESLREIDVLRGSQANSLRLTLISVLLGVGAIVALSAVLRSLRRRLQDATVQQLEQLERAALTDSLTGVRNHRAFEEDLARALAHRRRHGGTLSLVMLDVDGLKAINDTEGHQAGDRAILAVGTTLGETMRASEAVYRIGGDEFAALLPGATAWQAFGFAQRVHAVLSASGAPVTVSAGVAEAGELSTRDRLTDEADLALTEAKSGSRDTIVFQPGMARPGPVEDGEAGHHRGTLASALARAVDAKDSYTHSHSEMVSELCALIASDLGLDARHIAAIRLAGLVHDVGKIGVPDAILQKPSALDPVEYETIKAHSALGHRILSGTDLSREAPWVLHHHERLDGGGYPGGLVGDDIPLESRIIHVADAFEAMISDRPYRRGMPETDAIAELQRHRGAQFDPAVVDALLAGLGARPARPTVPAG